jgi:hypothetical protein
MLYETEENVHISIEWTLDHAEKIRTFGVTKLRYDTVFMLILQHPFHLHVLQDSM